MMKQTTDPETWPKLGTYALTFGDVEPTVFEVLAPSDHTNLALAWPDGEVELITTTLPGVALEPETVAIKDWSEYSGLTKALMASGIVETTGTRQVGPFNQIAHIVRINR